MLGVVTQLVCVCLSVYPAGGPTCLHAIAPALSSACRAPHPCASIPALLIGQVPQPQCRQRTWGGLWSPWVALSPGTCSVPQGLSWDTCWWGFLH